MATAVFSWVNHVDGSATTLTESGHSGDLSVSNVADPIVGRRHRLDSLTGYGQADFGSNKTVGMVCLVFPRDTTAPSGTVTHTFDADGGTPGSGAAHSSGAVSVDATDGYAYHFYKPSANVTARYWRWTFNASGVTFVDVGRAWAGEAWTPTYNIVGGWDDIWDDLSRTVRAERSGAEYPDQTNRQRSMAFALNGLSSSERDSVREMQRIAGTSKQVLFCLDPDDPDKLTILGRMAATTPIKHRALSTDLYSKAFSIRESI